MLSIITPCSRPENLPRLFQSINFNKINHWYIVYDTSKDRSYEHIFHNYQKISEHNIDGTPFNSKSGNYQRNYALNLIKEGYVYFLDDDNLIHPDFFTELDFNTPNKLYTFDQFLRKKDENNIIYRKGNVLRTNHFDMAQFCFDISIKPKNLLFENTLYAADGKLIEELDEVCKDNHIYIPKILCYYNNPIVTGKQIGRAHV